MTTAQLKKEEPMSEETIQSLLELGAELRKVHDRLVREGKVKVVDGKPVFLK